MDNNMKHKSTIAVCGLMDSGKSTLIKSLLYKNTGRAVEPDALCIEQATGRTITGTRIACPVDDRTDLVFCDCPGHLEYLPEIASGLCAADGYILIIDEMRRKQSEVYSLRLTKVAEALGVERIAVVHSHAKEPAGDGAIYYDAGESSFDPAMDALLARIRQFLAEKKEPAFCEAASVVWFDSLAGESRYVVYDATGLPVAWERHGFHEAGQCERIEDLPVGITGRFLVCRGKAGQIVGVGLAR